MSVAALTQGLKQTLADTLDYSLPSTISYVTSRKNVVYMPTAGDTFKPSQQRHISFRLAGPGFVDVSTLCLTYDLNVEGKPIVPVSTAGGMFGRGQLSVAGTPVEIVEDFAGVSSMIFALLPPQAKIDEADLNHALDLDNFYNVPATLGVVSAVTDGVLTGSNVQTGKLRFKQLPVQNRQAMIMPLNTGVFGLFAQNKFLPLQMLGSVLLDLELGPEASWMDKTDPNKNDGTTWNISNLRLMCDVVELDSSLTSELASKMGSGVPLNFPINTWQCYQVANPTTVDSPTISVSRALSKIKQLYIRFVRDPANNKGTVSEAYRPHLSKPKLRLQIGAVQWPQKGDVASDSQGEWMYRLRLALGSFGNIYNCHGISREIYENADEAKFYQAIDLESMIESDRQVGFLGYSTRDNPTMTLSYKGLKAEGNPSEANAQPPKSIHVYILNTAVVSCSLDSCALLE